MTVTALPAFVDIHPSVSVALAGRRPVVALESTIITHGMPFPDNARMSESVEAAILAEGAVPALIAVIEGRIKVGMSPAERNALAAQRGLRKLSRADLAYAVSAGLSGGTTVAATMIVAALAGIAVFATGGIGGVHRGAETSFDISADLPELARTSVIVVAAGAKAILDIPKTLEILETLGVPVVAYGADVVPAFWSRDSGLPAPIRLNRPEEVAAFQKTRRAMGETGGMLVANPVPVAAEIPAGVMARHVQTALAEAEQAKVTGKAVTPFLLQRIVELTGGASLASNIALVENNARLAARLAGAML